MHRTASNKTALVSETLYIDNNENVVIASGQGEKPVSILSDEFCEEQALPYLLPKGKFGYKVPRFQMQITYFSRFVYEQYHLRSSIIFAMHKIKPGTLTAGQCIFIHEFGQRNTIILETLFI